ncbi:MAG TPA: recombination protein NinB [Phenylobacterium sp.]
MTRATFVLWSLADRRRAVEAVTRLTRGWRVEIKAPKRTLPQNDKMWAMLTEVSEQATWHGEKLSTFEWKDMFTAAVKIAANPKSVRAVPGLEGGIMMLGLHTSDMSVAEMADLITYMEFKAPDLGVQFSDGSTDGEVPKKPSPVAA